MFACRFGAGISATLHFGQTALLRRWTCLAGVWHMRAGEELAVQASRAMQASRATKNSDEPYRVCPWLAQQVPDTGRRTPGGSARTRIPTMCAAHGLGPPAVHGQPPGLPDLEMGYRSVASPSRPQTQWLAL